MLAHIGYHECEGDVGDTSFRTPTSHGLRSVIKDHPLSAFSGHASHEILRVAPIAYGLSLNN